MSCADTAQGLNEKDLIISRMSKSTAAKQNNPEEATDVLAPPKKKKGNFSVRMPQDEVGLAGKVYDTLNEIIALNEKMMLEFSRAGNTIGKKGKLSQRIEVPSTRGSWRDGVNSLNELISDLVHPTIEIAHVISSVAKGN